MDIGLYTFPNPNNGDRYDLSQEELDALLYKAYMNGYRWGRESVVTCTITTNASVEDKDDNTKWKEVWIK